VKDDSARDRAIERLVADRLRAENRAAVGDCLDPELLAAYVEHSLTLPDRVSCETHLACCSRCQEQVAALVRLREAEEPAEIQPVTGTARFSWLTGPRWAWAAPVIVALVIGGLWYTVEYRRYTPTPEQRAPKISTPTAEPAAVEQAQETETRSVTAPATRDGAKERAQGKGIGALALRARPEESKAPQLLKMATAQPAVVPVRPAPPSVVAEQGAIATPATRSRLATTAPADQPANSLRQMKDDVVSALPAAKPESKMAAGAPIITPALTRPKQTAAAESAVNLRMSGQGEPYGAKKRAALQRSLQVVVPPVAPDLTSFSAGRPPARIQAATREGKWRVGARGLIQKSGPGGRWISQPSGVDVDLFAITFPTPGVGWAVGQAGTVLRTIDGGNTWFRCESPTSEDLVRVSGLGESTARAETRTGRVLLTLDGGKTWSEERR
jgi:hypothetical protein